MASWQVELVDWPEGFIPGVGPVPGGPRPRAMSAIPAERTLQIETGSVVIVPKLEDDTVELHQIPNSTSEDQNLMFFPGGQDPTDEIDVKPAQDALDELPFDFGNHFSRMLMEHHRNSATHSRDSRRQHTYHGPCRDRSAPSRARSRSPSRANLPHQYHSSGRIRDASSGSPVPSPGPASAEQPDPCTCPISYNCLHRRPSLLDCRPLVREWQSWEDRADQDTWERHRMAAPHDENRTTYPELVRIINIINDFENTTSDIRRRDLVLDMRDWILNMEDVSLSPGDQQQAASRQVVPAIDRFITSQNTLAQNNNNTSARVPDYIREELQTLQRKWYRGDFDGRIHRGLLERVLFDTNGIPRRATRIIDEDWPHRKSGLAFGDQGLVNGQIFMSRLELARDGVHAPHIAGISGTANRGAYSIVLGEFNEKKNIGYANVDMGNVIEYMGTAQKDDGKSLPTNEADEHMDHPHSWNHDKSLTPTVATQAMMKSFETQTPIRVVRSWKMCSVVKNRPTKGYRYDGMYTVVGKTPMKEARQIWSFRLERCEGQGRLRGFALHEDHLPSDGKRRGHRYREG